MLGTAYAARLMYGAPLPRDPRTGTDSSGRRERLFCRVLAAPGSRARLVLWRARLDPDSGRPGVGIFRIGKHDSAEMVGSRPVRDPGAVRGDPCGPPASGSHD